MDKERKTQKGTFIIKVEYLQHGTWQGQLTWAEENRHMKFRSALELIKLMDEAMKSAVDSGEEKIQSIS